MTGRLSTLCCLVPALLIVIGFAAGCDERSQREGPAEVRETVAAQGPAQIQPAAQPTRTIVWISVDGIRPDYLDRATLPNMHRWIAEGALSREFVPVFPSLTFSSHVSKATGATVNAHGIPSNSFIDRTDWRVHRYPWSAQLLDAEPIWTTATRQGLRVISQDWPLSHEQRGEHATAYHGERFPRGLSGSERMALVSDSWNEDVRLAEQTADGRAPIRLALGYMEGPDSPGHSYGPDAEEPIRALEVADGQLGVFMAEVIRLWELHRAAHDELYLIITTDHGMSDVHTLVNLNYLAGILDDQQVAAITSGNVGHIFVRGEYGSEEHETRVDAIVAKINEQPFASAYRRADLPPEWGYDHPTRTGDVVAVIDTGYTFSGRPREMRAPVTDFDGPLGMHGYDPATNPEMNGIMLMWRYPEPLGGIDLGRVHSLQMHATVAELLGIEPAETARRDAIELPWLQK